MGSLATYCCISLPGQNKVADMESDGNGYYRMILGGFNISNQSGIYYPLTDAVKNMFGKGGHFRRRLDSGMCRGEYNHPSLVGLTHEQAVARLAVIDPTLVSHHIKSVELVAKKDEFNKDIVLAYGMVKPSGPYGEVLKQSLDNREENVAFSIRSFCDLKMYQGRISKLVNEVLTYDHVPEPGIKKANQFDTVCLESLTMTFTEQDFDRAILATKTLGLENDVSEIRMIKDNLGWNKIEVKTIGSLNW